MPISLMPIIQSYVDASNGHDVKSILACFADDAIILTERNVPRQNRYRTLDHRNDRQIPVSL